MRKNNIRENILPALKEARGELRGLQKLLRQMEKAVEMGELKVGVYETLLGCASRKRPGDGRRRYKCRVCRLPIKRKGCSGVTFVFIPRPGRQKKARAIVCDCCSKRWPGCENPVNWILNKQGQARFVKPEEGCSVCGDTRQGEGWECPGCGAV